MQRRIVSLTFVICMVISGLSLLAVATQAEAVPVEVHGAVQGRLYFADTAASFAQIERIILSAKAPINETTAAYVEWYYHDWASSPWFLDSAYVDLIDKSGGRLRVGKGRSQVFGLTPSYGMRKTTEYGIASEAFTMDRIVGAQYNKTEKGGLEWGVGIHNTLKPSTRLAGFTADGAAPNLVAHLSDRDVTTFGLDSKRLAVSGRVVQPIGDSIRLGASYKVGKLSPADLTAFNTLLGTAYTSTTNTRWGVDLTYRPPSKRGIVANLEHYVGQTAGLDHSASAVLVGYEPGTPRGIKAYVRYGTAPIDITPNPANRTTWDVQQWMYSIVIPVRPNSCWVQAEYQTNSESAPAPASSVQNDIFFVELFTAF
jgi:hypothetical protein